MNTTQRLAANLTSETKAYGYTLTIWSAGTLLVTTYDTPTVAEVFLFVFGALAGFGALTAIVFRELFTDVAAGGEHEVMAASMIHFVATGGTLCANFLLVVIGSRLGLVPGFVFVLVGFLSTVAYNALLLAEEAAARLATSAVDSSEETPA